MREKQDFQEIALTILGITPASAGKTLRLFSAVLICLGSPPRVREKQVRKIGIDVHDRITPASAGKTTSLKYFSTLVRDHPRECGKNLILYHLMFLILGSPPRVREKLHLPYKKVYDQIRTIKRDAQVIARKVKTSSGMELRLTGKGYNPKNK